MKASAFLKSLLNSLSSEEHIENDKLLRIIDTLKQQRLLSLCFSEQNQSDLISAQSAKRTIEKFFSKIDNFLQSKNDSQKFCGLHFLKEAILTSPYEAFQTHYQHWTDQLLTILKVFSTHPSVHPSHLISFHFHSILSHSLLFICLV
jgi:hypothetical protein